MFQIKRDKEYRRIKHNLLKNGFIILLVISALILSVQYIQTNYNDYNDNSNIGHHSRQLLQTNDPTSDPTLEPTPSPTLEPTKTYEIVGADYPPDVFTKVEYISIYIYIHG